MKKLIVVLTGLIVFSLCNILQAQETIEFEGEFPSNTTQKKYIAAIPDNERLSNEIYGKFYIEFEGFTEEQKFAFKIATKLWEEAIPIPNPIYIKATFNGSGTNAYTVTAILNPDIENGIKTNTYFPMALLAQKTDFYNDAITGERNKPDITINFNRITEIWDFCTDPLQPLEDGKYDFVTETLRAIAQGIGFGASLNGREGRIGFKVAPPSLYIFDKNIRNTTGTILSSLQMYSSEINAFVKENAYWNRENYNGYQLYTPSIFTKNKTLCYFDQTAINDNEKLLMAPECNGRIRHIGSKILDILQDIGWEKKDNFKIINNEIDESGIVNHQPGRVLTFSSSALTNIQNYSWTYSIPQKDGSYRILSTGKGETFSIQLSDNYLFSDERTSSGYIKGRIHLTVTTTDHKTYNADYALFIQYSPSKPTLEIIEMIPTENYGCNLKIGFSSFGAESYAVEIIDEDAYYVWENPINQQGYATYTINDLFIDGNYTITITAISSRGNIKSDPLHFNGSNISDNTITTKLQEEYILIKTKNKNGTIIDNNKIEGTITDISGHTKKVFINKNHISIKDLPKGIYILSVKDKSGGRIVQKFIK